MEIMIMFATMLENQTRKKTIEDENNPNDMAC
jgi:hypothetical protein